MKHILKIKITDTDTQNNRLSELDLENLCPATAADKGSLTLYVFGAGVLLNDM